MPGREKISEITETLKTVAAQANLPIVISFQYNRKVKKTNASSGGFENVGLSDAIGQIASVGIGIFDDEADSTRKIVEIVGGREGETGNFFMNWNWDRMNFDEIEVDSEDDNLLDFEEDY